MSSIKGPRMRTRVAHTGLFVCGLGHSNAYLIASTQKTYSGSLMKSGTPFGIDPGPDIQNADRNLEFGLITVTYPKLQKIILQMFWNLTSAVWACTMRTVRTL